VNRPGANKPGSESARHRGKISQGVKEPGGERTRGKKARGQFSQGTKRQTGKKAIIPPRAYIQILATPVICQVSGNTM